MERKKVTHKITVRLSTEEYLMMLEICKQTSSKTISKGIIRGVKLILYYKQMAFDLQNEIDFLKYEQSRK